MVRFSVAPQVRIDRRSERLLMVAVNMAGVVRWLEVVDVEVYHYWTWDRMVMGRVGIHCRDVERRWSPLFLDLQSDSESQ